MSCQRTFFSPVLQTLGGQSVMLTLVTPFCSSENRNSHNFNQIPYLSAEWKSRTKTAMCLWGGGPQGRSEGHWQSCVEPRAGIAGVKNISRQYDSRSLRFIHTIAGCISPIFSWPSKLSNVLNQMKRKYNLHISVSLWNAISLQCISKPQAYSLGFATPPSPPITGCLPQVCYYCINVSKGEGGIPNPNSSPWNFLSMHKICLWEGGWHHYRKFQINNLSSLNTFLSFCTSICFCNEARRVWGRSTGWLETYLVLMKALVVIAIEVRVCSPSRQLTNHK